MTISSLMYSFPNLEPVSSISGPNCCFFTCIQISQEAGKVVWYFNLLKNFPQFIVIHTVKCFGIVKRAEPSLANNVPSSQSYGFSSHHVWMWELDYKENWALKDWCFWTVLLEKTLESFLYCIRSNQSILKKISPEYPLEGLMVKLKRQYFGHLMRRTDSLEKTLMLGKIEGRRRRGRQGWDGWMASPTLWTWVWASSRSW